MEINQTPIRTSKNYGINNFCVPDNLLNRNFNIFENINLAGDCKIETSNALPVSPICEQAKTQLEKANSRLKIVASKNQKMNVEYEIDSQNLAGVLEILAKENSNATVLVKLSANKNGYSNLFLKCAGEPFANLTVYIVCQTTHADCNLIDIEIDSKENSTIKLFVVDFAGHYSVSKMVSNVQKNAKCAINHVYIGKKQDKIDINSMQNVIGERAIATTNVVGALFDSAEKNFKGTIDFKHGSTKSKASESEYCMLLSKDAKSKTMPILLSHEDDVDGSHSSATGKIDEKELFYCMSRGMEKQFAIKMLVKAKFNNIIEQMTPALQQELFAQIDKEIDDEE